ncbi:hypothetical protein [Cellulosimicrobium sp. TH-20]|uniref:hypothetical protein n=1 Tax=Cellulosimicrobium sp. TH-20 TaxID=1980001 RepID=UPI0011A5E9D8|nr:hypothetical protein [Cellulosimicrobium sp. TH-20]
MTNNESPRRSDKARRIFRANAGRLAALRIAATAAADRVAILDTMPGAPAAQKAEAQEAARAALARAEDFDRRLGEALDAADAEALVSA